MGADVANDRRHAPVKISGGAILRGIDDTLPMGARR